MEPVPDWTNKVDIEKHNDESDKDYVTEDEVEMTHRTKVNDAHATSRILTEDNATAISQRITEQG